MIRDKEIQRKVIIDGLCYAHNFLVDLSVYLRKRPSSDRLVEDNEITETLWHVQKCISTQKHFLDCMEIKENLK
jgi:hypothetical protein